MQGGGRGVPGRRARGAALPHHQPMTTLARVLGDALVPTLKSGVWRKPALSGRAAASARRLLAAEGEGDEARCVAWRGAA